MYQQSSLVAAASFVFRPLRLAGSWALFALQLGCVYRAATAHHITFRPVQGYSSATHAETRSRMWKFLLLSLLLSTSIQALAVTKTHESTSLASSPGQEEDAKASLNPSSLISALLIDRSPNNSRDFVPSINEYQRCAAGLRTLLGQLHHRRDLVYHVRRYKVPRWRDHNPVRTFRAWGAHLGACHGLFFFNATYH